VTVVPAAFDATGHPALSKIVNVMGRARAETVIRETMRRAGLDSIDTPDDRYRFACALMAQGGLCEVIGRSMKIQAILHGAKEV
jgi:hypothetical protein